MRIIYLVVLSFICLTANGQNMPVFSKVTATWCPNCGSWGWDYMEAMKDEFEMEEIALPLGVHYSGTLANETAIWFAENLKAVGQPVFYINNERFSVGRNDWSSKIEGTMDEVEFAKTQTIDVIKLSALDVVNGKVDVTVNISTLPVMDAYLGVYLYENNVEEAQSGSSADDIHPNVLRAAMTPNPEGISISDSGSYDFSMDLDPEWNEDEVGLLMIVWRRDGDDYTIRSSQAVSNLALRLNVENTLDESLFVINSQNDELTISTLDQGIFKVTVTDLLGREMSRNTLNQNLEFNVASYPSGNYILNITQDSKSFTKQVFVH